MIEAGEYVRTKKGTIHKIEKRDRRDGHLLIDNIYNGGRYFTFVEEKEDIVKHSKNIIDLLEVGDFVNEERILDMTGDYIRTRETMHNKFYLEKYLKTILTKECYEANCYKIDTKQQT